MTDPSKYSKSANSVESKFSFDSEDSYNEGEDNKHETSEGITSRRKSPNVFNTMAADDRHLLSPTSYLPSLNTQVVEEPWYTAPSYLRQNSWDKSPSRSFLRNFP